MEGTKIKFVDPCALELCTNSNVERLNISVDRVTDTELLVLLKKESKQDELFKSDNIAAMFEFTNDVAINK